MSVLQLNAVVRISVFDDGGGGGGDGGVDYSSTAFTSRSSLFVARTDTIIPPYKSNGKGKNSDVFSSCSFFFQLYHCYVVVVVVVVDVYSDCFINTYLWFFLWMLFLGSYSRLLARIDTKFRLTAAPFDFYPIASLSNSSLLFFNIERIEFWYRNAEGKRKVWVERQTFCLLWLVFFSVASIVAFITASRALFLTIIHWVKVAFRWHSLISSMWVFTLRAVTLVCLWECVSVCPRSFHCQSVTDRFMKRSISK